MTGFFVTGDEDEILDGMATGKPPTAPPRPTPILQWASQPDLLRLLHVHVPADECILGDYACAWNKDVLIQGRMYLTDHHVAFKGWSNVQLLVDLTDIVSITKRSLALVIPNAIEIETPSAKYFFASFFSRDEVFERLTARWNAHVDQGSLFRKYPQIEGLECVCHAMLQQSNMGQRQGKCDVCMARGRLMLLQELDGKRGGKDSVTDSLRRLKDENETIGRGATVSGGSMTRGVPIPISSSSLQSAKGRSGLSGRSSQTPPSSSSSHSRASTLSPGPYHSPNSHSSFIVRGAMASSTSLPNPPTHGHEDEFHHHENSEEDEHHTKVENVGPAECPCSRAEGSKTLLDITLPVSLEKFAQHMVLTTKPRNGWYIEFFRDVVKISDLKIGPWVPKDVKSHAEDLDLAIQHGNQVTLKDLKPGLHRSVQCTMPLTTNSFGPKSALCFVEQTIEDYVPGEYICLFNKTQTPHAPYGTSFHSEGRVCISRVSRTKTRAVTTYSVVFTKSTILKGTISKNAIAGSEKFYQDFERFVKGSLHLPMDVANEKSGHRQVRSSGSTTNQGVVKDSTTVSSSSTYTSLSASSIGDDSERDWSVFFSWSTITWIGVLVLMTLQSIVLVKLVTVLDKVASRMDSGHTGL